MSERKVLNKYYPPDFDPSKIPKLRLPKNRTFNIRLMAPFNMRCNTCGEYIYKGKKFNSRKETVESETYLGLHIYRFYIKCPRCIAEISFRTDPANTDYELEAGATRNFEALRTAEKLALKEQKDKEDEEANNPMKLLENRTKASQREMDTLETLEDLKEMRRKQESLSTLDMLRIHKRVNDELEKKMDEEDRELEEMIKLRVAGNLKRRPDLFKKTDDEPPEKDAKSETNKRVTCSTTPKIKSSWDNISKQYEKIRESIRPKPQPDPVQKAELNTTNSDLARTVINSTNTPTPASSLMKLTQYSDSDEN